jgi:hypothetical protein
VTLADAGPALANNVLVQPFAGAEPEDKAVLAQPAIVAAPCAMIAG